MKQRTNGPASLEGGSGAGTAAAIQTAYAPERQALEQFDDLIAKLSRGPGQKEAKRA